MWSFHVRDFEFRHYFKFPLSEDLETNKQTAGRGRLALKAHWRIPKESPDPIIGKPRLLTETITEQIEKADSNLAKRVRKKKLEDKCQSQTNWVVLWNHLMYIWNVFSFPSWNRSVIFFRIGVLTERAEEKCSTLKANKDPNLLDLDAVHSGCQSNAPRVFWESDKGNAFDKGHGVRGEGAEWLPLSN